MKHIKLDRIDMRILNNLQENGRMTNVELAKKAGISAPPCLRRVKALEEAGFIKRYHAELAADKLGYGVTIFTEVNLNSHNESDLAEFARLLQTWPMVRESYLTTGDADVLLKVVAESWESYQKFLTTQIMAAPRVTKIRSTLVVKNIKNAPGIPLSEGHGKSGK
ncbi:MAG: Lrp/AsnC family transcriptional regulator [Alphaproteobacteria bacterium]